MAGDSQKSILRFEHVSVSFDEVRALDDVSFDVLEGGSRVIFGAAGSGKTILLKTALGLHKPDFGSVYLFNRDITHLREEELAEVRSKVGMLFQEGALFDSMTIEENVAYPLLNQKAIECPEEEVHSRVEETLRFVELGHTLEKFPSELSGGMRRRAAIARALVSKPPLLLYDSPTAGLDPITANTIIALIIKGRDLSRTTSLIVTHRYQDGNLLARFHYNPETGGLDPMRDRNSNPPARFMVLRDGRLIFEGEQAEIEASKDPYVSKFVKRYG